MDNYGDIFDYEDKTCITKYPDHANNYNAVDFVSKTNSSTETVWSLNKAVAMRSAENNIEPNGRPVMRQTSDNTRTDYDPYDYGNMAKPTSFWGTVNNLIIVSAGPTILSIPISFFEVGYVVGLVGTFVSTFLYAYSMHMLVWSEYEVCKSKRIPSLSFSDLIYFAFKDGPSKVRWFAEFGKYVIDVVFVLVWASGCCYDLELAAENVHIVHDQSSVHQILSWLILPVLLLCFIPKLKYFVPLSIVGNSINVLCTAVVIYDVFSGEQPFKGGPAVGSLTRIPLFLGTLFFTLNATGLMLPLKKDMKHPRQFNSAFGILTVTYIPSFFIFALFGLMCTLKYGSSVKETVIQNVQDGHVPTQYMVLANALALILQFPLYFFVIFEILWNSLLRERKKSWNNLLAWEYLLRTVITLAIFMITYTLPSVELFLTFAGAVGTMIDSLLFPACIQMVVMWKVSKNKSRVNRCMFKNTMISFLAVVLMVLGGASCIGEIIQYYT